MADSVRMDQSRGSGAGTQTGTVEAGFAEKRWGFEGQLADPMLAILGVDQPPQLGSVRFARKPIPAHERHFPSSRSASHRRLHGIFRTPPGDHFLAGAHRAIAGRPIRRLQSRSRLRPDVQTLVKRRCAYIAIVRRFPRRTSDNRPRSTKERGRATSSGSKAAPLC